MTWSGQGSSGVLAGITPQVYISRQYAKAFLSDTRHTSFYVTTLGCHKFIRTFMLTSWAVANLCFFNKTPSRQTTKCSIL